MVQRKKIMLGLTVVVLLAAGSVAAVANVLLNRYSLPGSADLSEVEYRITPSLAKRLAEQGLALGAPSRVPRPALGSPGSAITP